MNKTDVQKGKMVYYARMLKPVGIYEVCDLYVRTVRDDVGLVYARSGLSCKQGLAPANKVGVIDSDYRGNIMVALYNQSNETRIVSEGDRIAQIIIQPVEQFGFKVKENLSDTIRGNGGFGSSGKA